MKPQNTERDFILTGLGGKAIVGGEMCGRYLGGAGGDGAFSATWTFTERVRSSRKEQKHRLDSSWNMLEALRAVKGLSEFNTHLLHVAVFTVTELQVILEHAGKSDRQCGESKRINSFFGI